MMDAPLDGDRVELRNGGFYREGVEITTEKAMQAAQEGVPGAVEALEAAGIPEDAMTIPLGRRQKTAVMEWPSGLFEFVGDDIPEEIGSVCGTRQAARAFLWQWRNLPADRLIGLDAADVELATPSFFDELFKAWPRNVLLNADPEVQLTYDLVKERHTPRFAIGQAVLVDERPTSAGTVVDVRRGLIPAVDENLQATQEPGFLYVVNPDAGGELWTEVPEYNLMEAR